MYELSPKEFLYLFYSKLSQKLKKILELNEIKNKNKDENKELYETKSKMLESIDIMSMASSDNKLKESFNTLARAISSTNSKDIKYAIEFCTNTRRTENFKSMI